MKRECRICHRHPFQCLCPQGKGRPNTCPEHHITYCNCKLEEPKMSHEPGCRRCERAPGSCICTLEELTGRSEPPKLTTLEKLQWLYEHAHTLTIECNPHRNTYRTVAEYLQQEQWAAGAASDLFPSLETRAEAVRRNQLVEVYCYPRTPVSHYLVMHHSLNAAIDAIYWLVEKELRHG